MPSQSIQQNQLVGNLNGGSTGGTGANTLVGNQYGKGLIPSKQALDPLGGISL